MATTSYKNQVDVDILMKKNEDSKNLTYNMYPLTIDTNVSVNFSKKEKESGNFELYDVKSDFLNLHDYLFNQLLVNKKIKTMENKLSGVDSDAQKNQNAFSIIKIGDNKINSTIPTDTLELVAGSNISFKLNGKKITMHASETVYSEASEIKSGLLSSDLYIKLKNIDNGANNYTHPKFNMAGTYSLVHVNNEGHVDNGSTDPIPVNYGGTGVRTLEELKNSLDIPKEISISQYLDCDDQSIAVSAKAVNDGLKNYAKLEHGNHVPNNISENTLISNLFLHEGNEWKSLPEASTENSGIVRLSIDINSDSKDMAATEYSVNTAMLKAISVAKEEFEKIINGASEDFDTLKEIGDWVIEHEDLYTALLKSISNKVDKEEGKGLSENNLTDTLKGYYDSAYDHSKSQHAPSDSEKNTILSISRNGVNLTPDSNRNININITDLVSSTKNDSVKINNDNTMSINPISITNIDQGVDTIVFACGNSSEW